MPRQYDVYDDTGRVSRHHGHRHHHGNREVVPHHGAHGELYDPFNDIWGMQRSGFGSMFDSMLQGVQRSFEGMERAFEREAMNNGGGGSTYYYESSTRTVGPDGRVHEERIRTKPGADGRPETKRVVRDEHGREHVTIAEGEMPRFPRSSAIGDFRRDFGGWTGFDSYRNQPPPIQIEEVEDDDHHRRGDVHRRHSRRRFRRRDEEPTVEEPDDSSGVVSDFHEESNGLRERMRAWRNRS